MREGDSLATQQIWNRYFGQLVSMAQLRLKDLPQVVDGEDVALSALKSVMIGIRASRYPDLEDRTNLWPLLVTITARKSIDEVRRHRAKKRAAAPTKRLGDFLEIVSDEPSPEFAAEVADELERLFKSLDDPKLQLIARRKLEECTNDEIASELGCSVRTVIRKLNLIRQEWDENKHATGDDNTGERKQKK